MSMTVWTVTTDKKTPQRGRLSGAGLNMPCALGKGGVVLARDKREGDGCTPLGQYPFRHVFYRADKTAKPETILPCSVLTKTDGWCDAPDHASYNQHVVLPFDASHEKLWREDDIYDLILVIGHNSNPVEAGKGSAIFIHNVREGFKPTEGCVAVELDLLQKVLKGIQVGDSLLIV